MLQSDFLLRQPTTSSPLHGLVPVVPSLRVWQAGRLMLGVPVGGWKVWPLNSPAGRGGWGSEGQPGVKVGKDGRVGRAGNAVSAFLPGLYPVMVLTTGQPFLWHLSPHTPRLILSLALILHCAWVHPSLILTLSCVHNPDHRRTTSPVSSRALAPPFIQSLSQSHDLAEFWPY